MIGEDLKEHFWYFDWWIFGEDLKQQTSAPDSISFTSNSRWFVPSGILSSSKSVSRNKTGVTGIKM